MDSYDDGSAARDTRTTLLDFPSPISDVAPSQTGSFRSLSRLSDVSLTTTSEGEGHHIAAYRNVVFVDFSTRIELGMLRDIDRTVKEVLRRHPDGVGLIFIAEEGCRPPPISLRKEMIAMRQRTCDRTLAIAYVIRFDGFGASALRGAITGTQIVTRSTFPEKVFAKPAPGLDWLFPHCGFDSPFDLKRCHRMMEDVIQPIGMR